MKPDQLRVGLFQMKVNEDDFDANLFSVQQLFAKSLLAELDLLVLPELFLTGFRYEKMADTRKLHHSLLDFIATQAREHSLEVFGSLVLQNDEGKKWNTTYQWSSSGAVTAVYQKLHLFPYLQEATFFEVGGGLAASRVGSFLFGQAICYDLRFPELFAAYQRVYQVQGYILPAQWPTARIRHWETLVQARAIENQSYVLACNGVGGQLGGSSMIVHPDGTVLAKGGADEDLVEAVLEVEEVKRWREVFPSVSQWKSKEQYGY